MRKFQRLVLILDPLLEVGHDCKTSTGSLPPWVQPSLVFCMSAAQEEVRRVNKRAEERLRKRGRKDTLGLGKWGVAGFYVIGSLTLIDEFVFISVGLQFLFFPA